MLRINWLGLHNMLLSWVAGFAFDINTFRGIIEKNDFIVRLLLIGRKCVFDAIVHGHLCCQSFSLLGIFRAMNGRILCAR